jgi:hypothetical protein
MSKEPPKLGSEPQKLIDDEFLEDCDTFASLIAAYQSQGHPMLYNDIVQFDV